MNDCTCPPPNAAGAGGIPRGIVVTNPSGFIDPVAGGRKRSISKPALRITRGANDGSAHNFNFRIANPSDRLRLVTTAAFETDSGTELTIANVTWQLQAYIRNSATGRISPAQLIYGPKAAPDGYEVDTGTSDIKGTVFLPTTASFGFAVGDAGTWNIQCTWEPNESITDSELADLFAACSLTIDGSPIATTYL